MDLPKICGICGCGMMAVDTDPPVAEIITVRVTMTMGKLLFLTRLYEGVNGTIWKLGKNSLSFSRQRRAWYKWLT